MISIVVACGTNNAIGKDNRLLWHLPADLQFFKKTTLGKTMIMGRATFESIGKALPGRRTIVVTRNAAWQAEGAETANSLDHALEMCNHSEEIIIAGGADIYQQCFTKADRIYRTVVDMQPEADRFFPEISEKEYRLEASELRKADEKNPVDMRFEVWERNDASR